MEKKETKRLFESEILIMPALKMVLTETDQRQQPISKDRVQSIQKRPNQKTVMKIIEALNKAD